MYNRKSIRRILINPDITDLCDLPKELLRMVERWSNWDVTISVLVVRVCMLQVCPAMRKIVDDLEKRAEKILT